MKDTFSIKGIDKKIILAALYDGARLPGIDAFISNSGSLTKDELLSYGTYFDYVKGRSIKTEIGGDNIRPYLYDRDNGDGACYNVLENLLSVDSTD